MLSYCSGVLEHVDREGHAQIPTIQEQLATRRRAAGTTPFFALIEYEKDLNSLFMLEPHTNFRHSDTRTDLICQMKHSSILS